MAALSVSALPGLLLGLHRERFSGWLELERGSMRYRVQFEAGSPVRAISSRPRDGLARALEKQRKLSRRERETVEQRVAGGRDELGAIAALRRVPPRELLAALHDQARSAILSVFDWEGGAFSLEPAPREASSAGPGLDLPGLVFEALVRRARPDQVLRALGERATRFPTLASASAAQALRLPAHAAVEALQASLDGSKSAAELLGPGSAPEAAAALRVLDALGALAWSETRAAAAQPPESEVAPGLPELEALEIEIVAPARGDAAPRESAPPRTHAEPSALADERTEAIREEIRALFEQLDSLDHYALLGVKADAPVAAVKRAYLKLAKRLHPDAVARLGLEDVKEESNAVFARITRAHAVLSDRDQRARYDASLAGDDAADLERVAQAEALYRKGEILMRAGNFRGALELLEPAVVLWPDEADYQGAVGWCLFKKNPPELERAQQHLSRARALAGESAAWSRELEIVQGALVQEDPAAR